MKRTYLSGLMTSLPGLNFTAFTAMSDNQRAEARQSPPPVRDRSYGAPRLGEYSCVLDTLNASFIYFVQLFLCQLHNFSNLPPNIEHLLFESKFAS